MAQMKEQSKASERELSEEEIVNLSDVEFKTLVIKILTELIEIDSSNWFSESTEFIQSMNELTHFFKKMKKQIKGTQSEIKQNIQGTNSDRKETRTQSNDLEQKEEINIQIEQNEETRLQNKWRKTFEPLRQL